MENTSFGINGANNAKDCGTCQPVNIKIIHFSSCRSTLNALGFTNKDGLSRCLGERVKLQSGAFREAAFFGAAMASGAYVRPGTLVDVMAALWLDDDKFKTRNNA